MLRAYQVLVNIMTLPIFFGWLLQMPIAKCTWLSAPNDLACSGAMECSPALFDLHSFNSWGNETV